MRIRIDFGLVLPGLVIFLIGLALFVVWLLLVVVSFFLFFIPPLHGVFYFVLDLLAASLVLMLAGGLIALSGTRGWRREGARPVDAGRRRRGDELRPSERVGEFFGAVFSLLILFYFYENQVRATGFFTSGFMAPEQFAFYAPALFGIGVSLVRGVYARRNATRPLQAFQGALTAASALWLLYAFPFEFARLTALLPGSIQFLFWWVSNPVGQLVILLAVVGGVASMGYNAAVYALKRQSTADDPRLPA